jgi:large subunit ribosomal protein L32
MGLQQRKNSKRKCRARKAASRYRGVQVGKCGHCGAPAMPHRPCPSCGYYKGRQVLDIKVE